MEKNTVFLAWNKPIDQASFVPADPSIPPSLTPIVPLSAQDEGLVVFTDDPTIRAEEQAYEVTVNEPLSKGAIMIINKGMLIQETFYPGLTISRLSNRGKRSIVSVIVTDDGQDRIRPMFTNLGYPPLSLKRIRVNNFSLGTLSPGQWKFIKKQDII